MNKTNLTKFLCLTAVLLSATQLDAGPKKNNVGRTPGFSDTFQGEGPSAVVSPAGTDVTPTVQPEDASAAVSPISIQDLVRRLTAAVTEKENDIEESLRLVIDREQTIHKLTEEKQKASEQVEALEKALKEEQDNAVASGHEKTATINKLTEEKNSAVQALKNKIKELEDTITTLQADVAAKDEQVQHASLSANDRAAAVKVLQSRQTLEQRLAALRGEN